VSQELRAGTLRFTVAALGLVLGLSAAGVLPLLLPWSGRALLIALAVGLALTPFAGLWLYFRRRGALRLPLATVALAVALAPTLALAALFDLYRGQMRVLNHGDEPFTLWVDGRRVGRVEPSSGESALAGVELTLPSGDRELRGRAESDGRELFRARVHVTGGSPHLFAPLSAEYCFSIEQRGYGDASGKPRIEELSSESRFWQLPEGIAWFTPNPDPGRLATSGGTLSCLRQKRCRN
jgi:hypothetical protein